MAGNQKGFSLIELVVAMTVTLIITGAVFQLVTAGQSAFRREPELSDRQQNIRVAMDVISQDVYKAGYGAPTFAQVFTDDLDGDGPAGSGGTNSDILEMFYASECGPTPVCDVPGNGSVSMTLTNELSSCYQLPGLIMVADETAWAIRWAHNPGSSNSCPGAVSGSKNGRVNFPPGKAPLVNPPGGFNGWIPDYMLPGQAVRYRINMGDDGIPNLERSAFGGQTDLSGNSTWEIVARGVEDLQVEYENAAGWQDEPGTIGCGANCATPTQAEFDTLVRRVRIRLSARATGGGDLAGQTTSAVGNAVRGQLVSEIAPRPANTALGVFNGDQ